MGKSLEDIWGGANTKTSELNAAAEAARLAAEAARQEADEITEAEIKDLQQRILAGEGSSGNPLHDGIIALYGEQIYPELVSKYEKVASRLEQTPIGDPVVAIRRYVKSSGCAGFGGELDHSLRTRMVMGLTNGQQILFDYEKGTASLPTSKYAYDWWSDPRIDEVIEAPIEIDVAKNDYFHHLDGFRLKALDTPIDFKRVRSIDLPPFETEDMLLDTELLIGRAHIAEWLGAPDDNLARDRYFRSMRELTKKLGVDTIEPVTQWQKVNVEYGHY